MKKVFALLAIAGFVACNNGTPETPAVDSAKIKDSLAKLAVDTAKVDTAKVDTSKAAADTTKK